MNCVPKIVSPKCHSKTTQRWEGIMRRKRWELSDTDGVRKLGEECRPKQIFTFCPPLCFWRGLWPHSPPPVHPSYPRFLSYSIYRYSYHLSLCVYFGCVSVYLCHIALGTQIEFSQKVLSKYHLFLSVSVFHFSHANTHTEFICQWLHFISWAAGESDIKVDKREFNGRRRKPRQSIKLLAWGINLYTGFYSGFLFPISAVGSVFLLFFLLNTKSFIIMPLLYSLFL